MTLPHGAWVGLHCVVVVFPDHTHFLENVIVPTWKFRTAKWHGMISQ